MSRAGRKSTVISARLYEDDELEGKALEIFNQWLEISGLNKSQIITRALLALGKVEPPASESEQLNRLFISLQEVQQTLEELKRGGVSVSPAAESPTADLDQSLIASLAKRAKPGMRIDK